MCWPFVGSLLTNPYDRSSSAWGVPDLPVSLAERCLARSFRRLAMRAARDSSAPRLGEGGVGERGGEGEVGGEEEAAAEAVPALVP